MEWAVSIISICASGVVASLITYRLSANKEHIFFMRQKGEQLFLSVERFNRGLVAYYVVYYPLFQNQIEYNDLLDMQNKDSNREMGEAYEQVQMLISLYFPTLQSDFDSYIAAREKVSDIIGEHKKEYKRGNTDGTPYLKRFNKALADLDTAGEKLKEKAVAESLSLASAESLWPIKLKLSNTKRWLRLRKKPSPTNKQSQETRAAS